jgi:hypothetical protein
MCWTDGRWRPWRCFAHFDTHRSQCRPGTDFPSGNQNGSAFPFTAFIRRGVLEQRRLKSERHTTTSQLLLAMSVPAVSSGPEPQIQARSMPNRPAKLDREGRAVAERSPSRLSSAAARGALAARRIYPLSRKCPYVKPSAHCPCPKPQRPAESPGPRKLPGPPLVCLWLRVVAHVDVARKGCALRRPPRRVHAHTAGRN